MPLCGLLQPEHVEQFAEAFTIFGAIDGIGTGAEDRDAGLRKRNGQLERRLSAELQARRPCGCSRSMMFSTSSSVRRLKIQPVGGVVIRAHRFGIAIHHDGFNAFVPQRHGCMHATVIEFDPLADPIRPTAQDDHLLPIGRARLALASIGRIEIGRVRFEFSRAGIHSFVGDRPCILAPIALHESPRTDRLSAEVRNPIVREPEFFGLPEDQPVECSDGRLACSTKPLLEAMRSRICSRNQGSIFVSAKRSSFDIPNRMPSARYQIRSAMGLRNC